MALSNGDHHAEIDEPQEGLLCCHSIQASRASGLGVAAQMLFLHGPPHFAPEELKMRQESLALVLMT